jgi:hypothetical protein
MADILPTAAAAADGFLPVAPVLVKVAAHTPVMAVLPEVDTAEVVAITTDAAAVLAAVVATPEAQADSLMAVPAVAVVPTTLV